jgi:hypothetical protein
LAISPFLIRGDGFRARALEMGHVMISAQAGDAAVLVLDKQLGERGAV